MNMMEGKDDAISRRAAIKLAIDLDCESRGIIKESKCREIENRYNMIPAAQPPTDEWCTDCKEYDQKKHCCHRFTKVILQTVEELKSQTQWIPCSERLPLIEENPVLVSWMGLVNIGWYNSIDGWTTGTRFNADEVDAWMKLPEPYKGGEQDG